MGDLGEKKTQKTQTKPKEYCCGFCHFLSSNKKDYNRHLSTNKHKNNIKGENMGKQEEKGEQTPPKKYNCEICDYNTKDFTKYKRHCNTIRHKNLQQDVNAQPKDISNNNITIDKDVFLQIVNDNQEFKKMLIDQNNQILEQNQQIIELSKHNHIVSTTNNNNTTNNNTINNNQRFNLNVFLNEECKNAINWTDFINSIELSKDDLLSNGSQGFVNGISNIIISNLKQLDVYERPIHCTDLKRKSVYIRDENNWDLQDNYNKFESATQKISDKTKNVWVRSIENDNLSIHEDTALMIACKEMLTTSEHLEKVPKIANNIMKEVTIEKSKNIV